MTSPSPIVQGWCPGALRPMDSGDGWVVRLRPRAGRLTGAQAGGIAALARAHGNGLIDLSARGNVQLRGITAASHAPLMDGLRALDLLDDSAAAEARRNVCLTPFWQAQDGAYDLARALSAALTSPSAPRLSSKFGFLVDLADRPALRETAGDIRIEVGADSAFIYGQGAKTGAQVGLHDAVDTALSLAAWFTSAGGIGPDGRGRMGQILAAGATLPLAFAHAPVPPAQPFTPRVGLYPQGALVGFEFGQLSAETLAQLAGLGALRVTPWRMLLLEGASAMPNLSGLITAPDDPMLRITACTGAPACVQGLQPTRPLARHLARTLAEHVPQGHTFHISGCAKGCAHPAIAALTLTATARGFDLVRNGRAGDRPQAQDLTPDQISQALHAP